jgi:hypothetical protein
MARITLGISLVAAACAFASDGVGYFANTDGSFGLTLNVAPTLKTWEADWPRPYSEISLEHTADVVIGSKTESLPNHIYGTLAGRADLLDWPFAGWDFDLNLPGVGLEASQDLGKVDWTLSAHAALYNLYLLGFIYDALYKGDTSDAPSLRPSSVGLGYAYVGDWRGADTLGPGWRQRVDGRLFLTMPILKNLSIGFLGRAFNQPGDAFQLATWKYMAEPVVTFKYSGIWTHVMYGFGSLPPLYEPVKAWKVGVGFAFD